MPRHVTIVYRCPFSSDTDSKYQSMDWEVGKEIRSIGLGLFGLARPVYDVRVKHGFNFGYARKVCIIADCKYEPGTPEMKKIREKIEEIVMKKHNIPRDELHKYITELTTIG